MDAIFDGWDGIVRVIVAAPIMYVAIIAFVRVMGKRSTSQMNNFDWVVTVALGSLVASGIILESVTIIEALLATALLMGLQWVLTKCMPHSKWLEHVVKAEPRILVEDGKLLDKAMQSERMTPDEIYAAMRSNGIVDLADVQWVILETDATLSVIGKGDRDHSGVTLPGIGKQT